MRRRVPQLLAILIAACVLLVTALAGAAPKDGAAKKQIDDAINKYYVTANFDKAETVLVNAISSCAGQCSAAVTGKAWMYVGVVRGSGKNNQKGAKEAFGNALAADPKVQLDEAIATPETKKTFLAVQRERGASGGSGFSGSEGGEEPSGAFDCALKVAEVQTRRPIPITCTGGSAKKVDLRYKVGGAAWKSIKMKKKGEAYQATIPCTATAKAGALRYFVRAEDKNGDPMEGFGKKSKPAKIKIVKETEEEPPAFAEKEPPTRCSKAKAGVAGKSEEAEEEEAPAEEPTDGGEQCSEDEDCEEGVSCVEGVCGGEAKKKKKKKGPAGPYTSSWVGLHFAWDFALTGGRSVCSQDSQQNAGFACFYEGTEEQYRFNPHPRYANDISTGLAPATFRALISFDQLLNQNFSAGVRTGYAFGGGPPSGKKKDVKFLPFHFELRASYWPGDSPFSESGLRPYVGVQGGAAQVDAKLPVKVGDCAGTPGGPPSRPGATTAADANYYNACSKGGAASVPLKLDAYKKLGKAFAGVHAGVMIAVSRDSGIVVNLDVMQMLPTSGQVFEPSLGYAFGL